MRFSVFLHCGTLSIFSFFLSFVVSSIIFLILWERKPFLNLSVRSYKLWNSFIGSSYLSLYLFHWKCTDGVSVCHAFLCPPQIISYRYSKDWIESLCRRTLSYETSPATVNFASSFLIVSSLLHSSSCYLPYRMRNCVCDMHSKSTTRITTYTNL